MRSRNYGGDQQCMFESCRFRESVTFPSGPEMSLSSFFLFVCFCLFQVPKIHWDLSTKRVLTMEFVDGGQVNDREYMVAHGINVNEVREPYASRTNPRASARTFLTASCR